MQLSSIIDHRIIIVFQLDDDLNYRYQQLQLTRWDMGQVIQIVWDQLYVKNPSTHLLYCFLLYDTAKNSEHNETHV
jgi:hypothetical protein